MNANEYQGLAQRTKSTNCFLESGFNASGPVNQFDLLHAAIGVATEAGEFLDAMKKSIFYGKKLDVQNIREELGDILWYVAIAAQAAETTLEEVMAANIRKLQTRFPDHFTEEAALKRDTAAEMKAHG